MIVSIHQPNHLPYLGFFDKIAKSDRFIIYDDAQFVKGDFHNRNKIRAKEGFMWLTVPVKASLGQAINETAIDSSRYWAKKHLKSIVMNYEKCSFFDDYIGEFEQIYNTEWKSLSELNIRLIRLLLRLFGLKTELRIASEIGPFKGHSTERLVDMCMAMGAKTYLSGLLGKNYIDESLFSRNGIMVEYQNFIHPEYRQAFEGFIPNMSAIDLLFNYGGESLKVLLRKRQSI